LRRYESVGFNKQSDLSCAPTTLSRLLDKPMANMLPGSVHLLTPKSISIGRIVLKGIAKDRKQRNDEEATEP
jgi:hypothetical protein